MLKVTGWPSASRRRSAVTALRRASLERRRAAAMMWAELSARIGGVLLFVGADGLKLGDHAVEVRGDLLVHLGDAEVAVVPGGGDQGEGALLLLAKLGQELGAGDEDRAGEARVGVRALPLDRQAAVAVGQRLGRDAVPGLRPLRLAEWPVRVDSDPLAADVRPWRPAPSAAGRSGR